MIKEKETVYEVYRVATYPDDTGFSFRGTLDECRKYCKEFREKEASDFIGYIIYKRIEYDKEALE